MIASCETSSEVVVVVVDVVEKSHVEDLTSTVDDRGFGCQPKGRLSTHPFLTK